MEVLLYCIKQCFGGIFAVDLIFVERGFNMNMIQSALFTLIIVGLFTIFFPYQETRTEKYVLLAGGNYRVVEKVFTSGIHINTGSDFMLFMEDKEVDIGVEDDYIVYQVSHLVGKEERLLEYRQYRGSNLSYGFEKRGDVNIDGGVLTLTLHKDWGEVRVAGMLGVGIIAGIWLMFGISRLVSPTLPTAIKPN